MSDNLNFSLGKEPRLWVEFQAWPAAEREEFMRRMSAIDGVKNISPAGGTIGAYVYHDPAIPDTSGTESAIRQIANELIPGQGW